MPVSSTHVSTGGADATGTVEVANVATVVAAATADDSAARDGDGALEQPIDAAVADAATMIGIGRRDA